MKLQFGTTLLLALLLTTGLFAQGGGTYAIFDGSRRYLSIGDKRKYNKDFSVEMWVYAADWTPASDQKIMSCTESSKGWQIKIDSDGYIYFRIGNGTLISDCKLSASGLSAGWHHIAVTYDHGSDTDIYIDGSTHDDGSATTVGYDSDNALIIGAEAGGGSTPTGHYFERYMDEIRIWDIELTQANIQEWMHKPITSTSRPSYYNDLRAYYKLDTDWSGGWLDDASPEIGSDVSERDLTNNDCTAWDSSPVIIGDYPTGYITDTKALWSKTGTSLTDESGGLALKDYSGSLDPDEFYAIAHNENTGTTTADCPSGAEERASRIWYFDDVADDAINLQFDCSDFATSFYQSELSTSDYKLLRRTGTSGSFTAVASAASQTLDQITFENQTIFGDAYYTIGKDIDPATVTTNSVTSITQTTATCGGNVTANGGGAVSARGVCWRSTGSHPTITDSKTTDGSGTGTFTSSLTGLSAGTPYYVRAYATNSDGTSYGENQLFTSEAEPVSYTTIDADYDGANSVSAADIDGDGDMDVLGTAANADEITWWENNGSETFTEHTLSSSYNQAYDAYAADIDSDGDMDIVAAAADGKISWWDNDGSENFTERIIISGVSGVHSIHADDIDGDGDIDVLGIQYEINDIIWYENDGSPADGGWTVNTVDADLAGPWSGFIADMDNDGDMDILSSATDNDEVVWYENNGSESFTKRTIDTEFSAYSIHATDINNDGYMDVIAADRSADKIKMWKNDGTPADGGWIKRFANASRLDGVRSVHAADVDGDGDMDVIGAAENDDEIAWYENDGIDEGEYDTFSETSITTGFDGAYSVYVVDLDDDGDMDFLGAANRADDIAWWETNGSPSATATATDGSNYSPTVTRGQEHQPIGRFSLTGSETLGLHTVTIQLNGIRSGASDFRLWQSSDATFSSESDIQLGNMVECDPGTGNLITFKNFASPVAAGGTYYFLTCDVASEASGEIQGVLVNNFSLDFSGGLLSGSITNAPLSDGMVTFSTSVQANIKVFLQGPYNSTNNLMNTDLKTAGAIPTTSPYSEDERTIGSIPNDIVDWVLVQLRSTSDGAAVVSKSAMLHKNGSIVGDDGTTDYIELDADAGDYFIVVKHRNHVAVMSAAVHSLSSGSSTLYDFTTDKNKYWGEDAIEVDTDPQNVYAMYAGDTDGSGTVDADDRANTWNDRNKNNYQACDCCLTNSVDADDRATTWNNRNKAMNLP